MRLIKPSWEIRTNLDGNAILKAIESAARTCYKSEDKITETSCLNLCKALVKRKHFAMIEHGGYISVKFIVNRGFTHEIVRHRICSFAQESTRYVNYSKKKEQKGEHITFVIPPHIQKTIKPCIVNQFDLSDIGFVVKSAEHFWLSSMRYAEENYFRLINLGWKPELARGVLPIDLKTEIIVSANPTEWRHIFHMRADNPAHPQMREMMVPLLRKFKEEIPIIFDDLFEGELPNEKTPQVFELSSQA